MDSTPEPVLSGGVGRIDGDNGFQDALSVGQPAQFEVSRRQVGLGCDVGGIHLDRLLVLGDRFGFLSGVHQQIAQSASAAARAPCRCRSEAPPGTASWPRHNGRPSPVSRRACNTAAGWWGPGGPPVAAIRCGGTRKARTRGCSAASISFRIATRSLGSAPGPFRLVRARRKARRIAQGFQLRERLLVHRGRLDFLGTRRMAGRDQLRFQLAHLGRVLGQHVAGLLRIVAEVVKLRLRRANVFPLIRADAAQFGPTQVDLRKQRFGVRNGRSRRPCRVNSGTRLAPSTPAGVADRPSTPGWWARDRSCGPAPCHPHAGRNSRAGKQERNAQRRIVKEHAVGVLAVFAQALAVIREHGHNGLLRRRLPPEGLHQASESRDPRRRSRRRRGDPCTVRGRATADRRACADRRDAPTGRTACRRRPSSHATAWSTVSPARRSASSRNSCALPGRGI